VSKSFPNPKQIRNIYEQAYVAQILRIAILLDIFSYLKEGRSSANSVADMSNNNPVGTEKLLECLYSYGLLEKVDHEYFLTDTTRTFFLKDSSAYVGDWLLEVTNPVVFEGILDSIKTGKKISRSLPWHQLAWSESYAVDRIEDSLSLWEKAGVQPGSDSDFHVLDLACGSGVVSLALAQRYPKVRVTGVDSSEVVKAAEDLAKRLFVQDQADFIDGDVHLMSFEEEKYDAVLLGNVTGFFTVQQNKDLFMKIHQSLKPGGKLLLDVTMKRQLNMRHENLGITSLLLWSIWGTEYYSYEEYEEWLISVGYVEVTQLSSLWLIANKAISK
jgi:SAM-dependent methyltransferase